MVRRIRRAWWVIDEPRVDRRLGPLDYARADGAGVKTVCAMGGAAVLAFGFLHDGGSSAAATRCTPSPVSYARGKVPGIPAVLATPRAGNAAGYLFYFGQAPFRQMRPRTALISINGHTKVGSTKILWWLPGGSRFLTISGQRLDASGSFHQTVRRALGGTPSYPSITNVPAAGCWRLTIRSAASSATTVFRAVRLK